MNQDGRTDAVVTHATEPVAFLMNRSPSDHQSIGFQLVATQGPRDAVGATVRFEVQNRGGEAPIKRTLFRLSGDGYMAANENVLRAGTRKASEVNHWVVSWSDGEQQSFGDLPCGPDYVLFQGHGEAFEAHQFNAIESSSQRSGEVDASAR